MKALLPLALAVFAVGCVKRVPVSFEEPPAIVLADHAPLHVRVEPVDKGGAAVAGKIMSVFQGLLLDCKDAVPVLERELARVLSSKGYTLAGASDSAVELKVGPAAWYGYVESRAASINRPNQHVVLEIDVKAGASPTRHYSCEAPLWPFNEAGGMDEAVQSCVAQLVADFGPKNVTRELRLDSSDPLGKPGLEAAGFDEALRKFTEASGAAPKSAALLYNRGVLTLWKGQAEEADVLLGQAVQLNPDGRDYVEAKALSERAVKARAAWGQRPVTR
jgi:hypothetical protein